jgi:hypothetical protein
MSWCRPLKLKQQVIVVVVVIVTLLAPRISTFGINSILQPRKVVNRNYNIQYAVTNSKNDPTNDTGISRGYYSSHVNDNYRRALIRATVGSAIVTATTTIYGRQEAVAAVGTLPELVDTNSVLQGITMRVADQSQQDAMIEFLVNGFNFEILRKRIRGTMEETWLGFGPEELSIPTDCTLPVSSFTKYGGHASIHLMYDTRETIPLYRIGDDEPGNNIAYVQVGVPGYRVSQMVANGGKIKDAYGIVDVVSPAGVPIRGIVGIAPDPLMFVAINCADVRKSRTFYESLGFVEQEYPYARPNKGKGQFEPPQPPKSVYMAQTPNSMGILLLPTRRGQKITVNSAVEALNIVYTPSSNDDDPDSTVATRIVDPCGIVLRFQSVDEFVAEEKETR